MPGQLTERQALESLTEGSGEYLEKTEKLLFRRLWIYIIDERWEGVGQVVSALRSLSLI